jgi:RNA polymerase sigma-70 factor, ECF subfamily
MDQPSTHNAGELSAEERTEAYLRLLTQNDRWLATYVYSLVHTQADAEDILQDCKVVMWKQFQNFVPGTNFRAWARKIATFHILNYRRAKTRHPSSVIDDEFIEAVAAEIDRNADQLEHKAEVLQDCLRKLPEVHRKAILLRYYEDRDIDEIASTTGQSSGAVYRLLSRIRKALNECVERRLNLPRAL